MKAIIYFIKDPFVHGYFIGVVLSFLFIHTIYTNNPSISQVGYTKQELEEMKNLCEKDLPRSEECVIVVTYKANNKQEGN